MMSDRILAIGDIHGCYNSLVELVEKKIKLEKSDKLIFLGDYIDRGQRSKDVVDFIIYLMEFGFDVIPLMGNHETMLLDAYGEKEKTFMWMWNGGKHTLNSFGIQSVCNLDRRYINFFQNLRYYYAFENYLFVHAGFNDELDNPFKDYHHMLWNCKSIYLHPELKEKIVVHGHCAIPFTKCDQQIKNKNKVLDIDTGCVFANNSGYGRLTALELNTGTIHFVWQ